MPLQPLHVMVSSGHFHRPQSLLECLDLGSETNVPMLEFLGQDPGLCSKDVLLLRRVSGFDFVQRYAEIPVPALTCLWEAANSIVATSSVAVRNTNPTVACTWRWHSLSTSFSFPCLSVFR